MTEVVVLMEVGDNNPSATVLPAPRLNDVIAISEDVCKREFSEAMDVLSDICTLVDAVTTSPATPDVDVVVAAAPPCPGKSTSGRVALEEVRAASGKSTLLKVAVETVPEDVSVTVSRLIDETRLESGPAVSTLLTNGSMSRPGLMANTMPSSQ